jgi:rhomboid-like protein
MFASWIARPSLRSACHASRLSVIPVCRPAVSHFRRLSQRRVQHARQREGVQKPAHEQPPITIDVSQPIDHITGNAPPDAPIKVRYLRPALWALSVSCGIFYGLAYLEAKRELKTKPASAGGWLQAPHWNTTQRAPPTPTEVVTGAWTSLDPISKVTYGLIGANSGIHLSSFLVPKAWDTLWHTPARNVNYTHFTSMFVHGGALHFFVNMYFLNNFMAPVGYSRLFEGSPYHTLSFYLSAGVLSGFAQHFQTWSGRIPFRKQAIPEIFIRSGGASGALFGILGIFCMQYPNAGIGILFVPVHFDAQYVLPAILLFDLVGVIRGYSFVNFGHAVSSIRLKFMNPINSTRLTSPAECLA